ncbi:MULTISPECIES: hypothetical protein [unclassified Clostridium]|uniref:hypothetical protein n=1 Tax=unclassified Clostridium TaxID=2614128 RepID=UPI0025C3D5F2|nr:hypothetical protein [Clostridium sp.]
MFNNQIKEQISNEAIKWFMTSYFNDITGGMTFTAYTNLVLSFRNIKMHKLWQIELLMFSCGVFWEFITPLYRFDTVSDIWDVFAYMLGGILYWVIVKNWKDVKYKKETTNEL